MQVQSLQFLVVVRDAQKDFSSLPVASQIYPQVNLTHFSGVSNTMPSSYDPQLPTPSDASCFSESSNLLPLTLTDMVNKVQQSEADLIEH